MPKVEKKRVTHLTVEMTEKEAADILCLHVRENYKIPTDATVKMNVKIDYREGTPAPSEAADLLPGPQEAFIKSVTFTASMEEQDGQH